MSHTWPQGGELEFFAPDEFGPNADLLDWGFAQALDELRRRCGFGLTVSGRAIREDVDMIHLYGADRAKWPNSPHWIHGTRDQHARKACAADISPAGTLTAPEEQKRRLLILYHAIAMWREGWWPRLGLEVASRHIHIDNRPDGLRPYTWGATSK